MKNIRPVKKRFFVILIWFSVFVAVVLLTLINLKDNISYYYVPSEIKKINKNSTNIRVGGFVKFGSIKKLADGKVQFEVEDADKSSLNVRFNGKNLPMIFRDGQGVIVKGKFEGEIFVANELITKHDEKYFPPNVNENTDNKK